MKFLIPLLVLFLFIFSFKASSQQVRALILDPDIDTKKLKQYKIERPELYNSLPDRAEREKLLAGITVVKEYDELQKDILFMDLKSKSLKELQKKYPKISKLELQQLKGKK